MIFLNRLKAKAEAIATESVKQKARTVTKSSLPTIIGIGSVMVGMIFAIRPSVTQKAFTDAATTVTNNYYYYLR